MNKQFDNQVVLVTGATAGIGRAAALAFAREGARLVVSGRNTEAGQKLLQELRALGAQAEFVQADVSREEQVIALVDFCVSRFGALDVAVNSAGLEGQGGSIMAQTVDSYTATFNANVLGTFLCLKHEMRVMSRQRSGAIVNLSSTMGSRGNPLAPMYVASKHAVEGLTKSVALEACPYKVRVNAVAPGPIATEMLNASPAAPISCPRWPPASRRAALASPTKWPTRFCSWPRARPATSPARSWPSMAARPRCDARPWKHVDPRVKPEDDSRFCHGPA